jgi:peptidoglycan/xylan/chitin deacetylase (PgdA/CDA1 family)
MTLMKNQANIHVRADDGLNCTSEVRAMIPNHFACLTYHVIGNATTQYVVSEGQLLAQLILLKAEGYVVEGFAELEGRLKSNQKMPPHYVVFTMDDGHESSMRAADIFEMQGSKATFFLTRDRSLKKPDFIREPQIRELRNRGFSVGTHGTTHRKLTFLSKAVCADELRGSKEWLEDVIGEEVRYMAAPAGFINTQVVQLASELGYTLIGTCREWMNSANRMILPSRVNRVNVRNHFSLRTFRHAIEGYPGFYAWRQVRSAALAIPKQVLRFAPDHKPRKSNLATR